MSWRVIVISQPAKLDYRLGRMVVRQKDKTEVNISEISTLIIASTAVSLTCCLLAELTKKKIKVIFCDEKWNPSSELVSYYGSHDTSNKIRQQIQWKKEIKEAVWTEIVTEKIRKQKELLQMLGKDEASLLNQYVREMTWNDESNREGHAAKVYFNALFGMDFTRTSDTAINAALNYGYSILLSSVNREIVSCGYLTQVGLFHDNMFNHFNLSSDLMEPFRPIVDQRVLKFLPFNEFTKEHKTDLIDLLNTEIYIDGRKQYLSNAIKIYCKSVLDALSDNNVSAIKFYQFEL